MHMGVPQRGEIEHRLRVEAADHLLGEGQASHEMRRVLGVEAHTRLEQLGDVCVPYKAHSFRELAIGY